MIRYRAHEERERDSVTQAESYAAGLRLISLEEKGRHGRYLLKGKWTWCEVVTLATGVYVGGDIETVVFNGFGDPRTRPRPVLYWMATRSYGYAREKASIGDTLALEWSGKCAREAVIWMRRDRLLEKDGARDVIDALDRECTQHEFVEALHGATEDCECLNAGEAVSQRVVTATAVLRHLVDLLEARDFQSKARGWFFGLEAAE